MLLARRLIACIIAWAMASGCAWFNEPAQSGESWRIVTSDGFGHPDVGQVDTVWVTFFLVRPGADTSKAPGSAAPIELSLHDLTLEGTTDISISEVCFDDDAESLFYAGETPAELMTGRNCSRDLPITVSSTREWAVISAEVRAPRGVTSWDIQAVTTTLSTDGGEADETTHDTSLTISTGEAN